MPAVSLLVADLEPFADIEPAKAQAMIDTALARAARVAPCLREGDLSLDNADAARGVIRDAILRWHDAGNGGVVQQSAGPFSQSVDTRITRRGLFWPSEIEELQAICRDHSGYESSGAFSVDTALSAGSIHLPWCSLNFAAAHCSCGASIAGQPIYELG